MSAQPPLKPPYDKAFEPKMKVAKTFMREDKPLSDIEGEDNGEVYISTKFYPDKNSKASTYVHKLVKSLGNSKYQAIIPYRV